MSGSLPRPCGLESRSRGDNAYLPIGITFSPGVTPPIIHPLTNELDLLK